MRERERDERKVQKSLCRVSLGRRRKVARRKLKFSGKIFSGNRAHLATLLGRDPPPLSPALPPPMQSFMDQSSNFARRRVRGPSGLSDFPTGSFRNNEFPVHLDSKSVESPAGRPAESLGLIPRRNRAAHSPRAKFRGKRFGKLRLPSGGS